MKHYLNSILNAINIFSDIENIAIDSTLNVSNISHHFVCPKQILEAYINLFTNLFTKSEWEDNRIYLLETDYQICFYLINTPHFDEKHILGPFLLRNYREKEIKSIITKHFTDSNLRPYINYYRMLPVLSSLQRIKLEALLSNITQLEIKETTPNDFKSKEQTTFVDPIFLYRNGIAEDVDRRYKIENGVLNCIRYGTPELLKDLGAYVQHKANILSSVDRLRNIKNLSISGNTLFRKAAEQGGVPPLYLDRTSREFAIQIENTDSIEELESLQYQMILTYCELVQNEKMSGYSAPIRKVIHYIHSHLASPLSLETLALQVNRNPKYLSSAFKKEVGKGVNQYINSARVQQSLTLLQHTEYSVSHIAMMVGFNDANYFTKIFSKEMGCPPSEYRNLQLESS